jgi:hypothetical protein
MKRSRYSAAPACPPTRNTELTGFELPMVNLRMNHHAFSRIIPSHSPDPFLRRLARQPDHLRGPVMADRFQSEIQISGISRYETPSLTPFRAIAGLGDGIKGFRLGFHK